MKNQVALVSIKGAITPNAYDMAVFFNGHYLISEDINSPAFESIAKLANSLAKANGIDVTDISYGVMEQGWCWRDIQGELVTAGKLMSVTDKSGTDDYSVINVTTMLKARGLVDKALLEHLAATVRSDFNELRGMGRLTPEESRYENTEIDVLRHDAVVEVETPRHQVVDLVDDQGYFFVAVVEMNGSEHYVTMTLVIVKPGEAVEQVVDTLLRANRDNDPDDTEFNDGVYEYGDGTTATVGEIRELSAQQFLVMREFLPQASL